VIAVIDRYLLAEILKTLAAILVTFTLVMVSLLFLRVFEEVALGELNPGVVLQVVSYQVLRYFPRLLPPAFFFSVLFVLVRMHRDSEMIALAAGGVGLGRVYRALLFPTLPLALLAGWFSLEVTPWAAAETQRVLAQQKEKGSQLAGVREGRFNEYGKGDLVAYVESIENGESMRNLFVQHRQHGKLGLVTASDGYHRYDRDTGDHYVVLNEGRRYEGTPGQADYSIAHFQRYTLRIAREERRVLPRAAAMPTAQLLATPDVLGARAELEDRLSYPISVITLALLALPLSRSLPRQGMYGRLFAAFLVYFLFLNLHGIAENLLESGVTPVWMGMWWFQAVMVGIAGLLLFWDTGIGRLFIRRR